MKMPFFAILPAAVAALLGAGCVAIPMGKETYTTEYPTDIRATWDSSTKTYEPAVVVADGDKDHHAASIVLKAKVTSEQPQEQQYKTVTVEKHKRLAIGLTPQLAQTRMYRPKGSLTPMGGMAYNGEGKYATYNLKTDDNVLAFQKRNNQAGGILTLATLGLVSTPVATFAEIFGPYEKNEHFLGSGIASHSSQLRGQTIYSSTTYDSKDIDLLRKFPNEEREKIGAWTYYENTEHPHHSFWHGFASIQWFGVYKYCNYFVKDSEAASRRTPATPKVSTSVHTVLGSYTATLSLPALGYRETIAVDPGIMEAKFNLVDAANGDATASGTVSYALPADGEKAVRNADDREILKLAAGREWPVTVMLPAPRAERVATPAATPTAVETAPSAYHVASIERPQTGGLVVRVAVDDTAKTFEIDREVEPEIRRMFREQFATGDNASRREKVGMELTDGGKTLVYTVVFE